MVSHVLASYADARLQSLASSLTNYFDQYEDDDDDDNDDNDDCVITMMIMMTTASTSLNFFDLPGCPVLALEPLKNKKWKKIGL